jgi:FtsZ-binding cell division protein ZapB
MATKQREFNDNGTPGSPGIGIDAMGGGVIDPTRNVLDLVRAESKYQDGARDALKELVEIKVDGLRELVKILTDSLVNFQNAQRESETRRIDQLAQTRQEFQNTIRDMLAESVRTTSTLVSTQLVQIQATFDTRVSKLEAGAFTQAGKEQRPDPALAEAMQKVALSIGSVQAVNETAMAKVLASISALKTTEEKTESRGMGQGQVIGWIVGAAMLIAAIVSPIIAFIALRPH